MQEQTTVTENSTLPPEVKEVETKALSIPDEARSIQVKDNMSFIKAARVLLVIKDLQKEIDTTFEPMRKKTYDAWKEVVRQKDKMTKPLKEAEVILKPQLIKYHDFLESKHKNDQLDNQEDALIQAEEFKLNQALALEAEGRIEEAEELLNNPTFVPKIVMPQDKPNVDGISFKTAWKAEVTDPMELLKAVVEGRAPMSCISINEKFLNQQAKSLKQEFSYPGVRPVKEKNVSAGSK